jgi:hypothetical protein
LPAGGEKTLLNSGWYARRANEVKIDGNVLTSIAFNQAGWIKARVPGTVLTTLLENNYFPAPEFSMNNNLIPDIYEIGNEFYTFWFMRPFEVVQWQEGQQIWLNFRGINYKADIFLNGKRVNNSTHEGMFLRKSFNITPYLKANAVNLLAVIVYPPDYPGNGNGGQGGDGVKVFDKNSGKRILPVHYSDNYVTLMPGDSKEITLEFTSSLPKEQIKIVVENWN